MKNQIFCTLILALIVSCGHKTESESLNIETSVQEEITLNDTVKSGSNLNDVKLNSNLSKLDPIIRESLATLSDEQIARIDAMTANVEGDATPLVLSSIRELEQKTVGATGLQDAHNQVEQLISSMIAGIEESVATRVINGEIMDQVLDSLLEQAANSFNSDDQHVKNMLALYTLIIEAFKNNTLENLTNEQNLNFENLKNEITIVLTQNQEERALLFDSLYASADSVIEHNQRLVLQSQKSVSRNKQSSKIDWPGLGTTDVGWPDRPRIDFSSDHTTFKTGTFSARVQIPVDIPGVSLALGPQVEFSTEYSVAVNMMAHDSPSTRDDDEIFVSQGDGFAPRFNQSATRRIHFSCDYKVSSTSKVDLAASASVMGIGGGAGAGQRQTNTVTYSTIYRYVPITNATGQNTTLNDMVRLCQTEISATKMAELENQLKLAARSYVMVSSKTPCVRSTDCRFWHQNMAGSLLGNSIYRVTRPTCVVDSNDPRNNFCKLQGIEGASCAAQDADGNNTAGWFEYPCAAEFTCKLEKNGGWNWSKLRFEHAEAKCRAKYVTIPVDIVYE